MIRNVNLIDHLPPYLRSYREMQVIMDAENPEFQSVEDASEIVKNNMFVLSTDKTGVERYEKMFDIKPSRDDSLANRQAAVLVRYTNMVIYTLRGLIERLDIMCGVDKYMLELISDEYRINITLHFSIKDLTNTVISMVSNMIPANMTCTYSIKYSTHKNLSNYPHYILMQFMHQELHDGVYENNISATCENISKYKTQNFELISCKNVSTYGMRKV